MRIPSITETPKRYSKTTCRMVNIQMNFFVLEQEFLEKVKNSIQSLTEKRWMPATLDVFHSKIVCFLLLKFTAKIVIGMLQSREFELKAIIDHYMYTWQVCMEYYFALDCAIAVFRRQEVLEIYTCLSTACRKFIPSGVHLHCMLTLHLSH